LPAFLRLYVEDAHAVLRQAVGAAGVSISEVTHLAFGDLVGRVRDPSSEAGTFRRRQSIDAEPKGKALVLAGTELRVRIEEPSL
jgi:hypothetical protein